MGQPPGAPFGGPNFPGGPGGITGMGGPPTRPDSGMGGFGGVPRFESVWTCSKCGHEVGRGTFKPDVANCPKCGTRFGNTMSGMRSSMREDMDAMRDRNRARMAEPFGPTPGVPGGGAPASGPANPGGAFPGLFNPPAAPPADEPANHKTGLKIVGITAGLLVLVGAVVGIVVASSGGKKPARRRRRPRDWDDDYDD
ncbi:MAG: transposase [Gemmataceae bacterium]|nr:transposase [Gemmataceae bacterium]